MCLRFLGFPLICFLVGLRVWDFVGFVCDDFVGAFGICLDVVLVLCDVCLLLWFVILVLCCLRFIAGVLGFALLLNS